tara:strand:+ start:200 stop:904 length:705 start_codon:yes stop_codon:yes gene_type:complete
MVISSSAIVLSKLKYRENDLIVKLLVRELGVTSFIVRGGSRKNKINYFQQLSLLEIEFDFNIKRSLHYFKDFENKFSLKTIHTDYKKMGVIIFLSEILSKILVHQQKDYQLFTFIEGSIKYYDDTKFNSFFHLVFLVKLSRFLGFYPEVENNNYKYFDLQHGSYTNTEDSNYIISQDELKCFNMILGINFDEINTLTLNSVQRKNLLDNIILYYKLQIENFVSVKSLEVLRKIF